MEGGLQQKTCRSQSCTCQHGGHGGGQTGAKDDVGDGFVGSATMQKGLQHISSVDVYRPKEDVEDEEGHNTHNEQDDTELHFNFL